MSDDSRPLFPLERLTSLSNWSEICSEFELAGLRARPLELADYERGFVDLIEQLAAVHPGMLFEQVPLEMFRKRFEQMRAINEVDQQYATVVVEDIDTGRLAGCATVFLQYEFVHDCGIRGTLKHLVVLDIYRGRGVGALIVKLMIELAREAFGCYKLVLNCKDEMQNYYEKNRFEYTCIMMTHWPHKH